MQVTQFETDVRGLQSLALMTTSAAVLNFENVGVSSALVSPLIVQVNIPTEPPPLSLVEPLISTMERLLEIDAAVYARCPEQTFGLEAKAAYILTDSGRSSLKHNPKAFWIRPAPEPPILSYWDAFKSWSLDDHSVCELASCLYGRPVAYRTAPSTSNADDKGFKRGYPPASEAALWLETMADPPRHCSVSEGLAAAFYAMATFVLYHPFADGNGRFGRALFQGTLARCVDLKTPMLPIGAFSYASGDILLQAWIQLAQTGSWKPFVAGYSDILRQILTFHLEQRSPSNSAGAQ